MRKIFSALALSFLVLLGASTHSQQTSGKTVGKRRELTPRRAECGLFLPAPDERRDMARLVRSDQFIDCERDGFPKRLAPPWKEAEEGEKKLGDACDYFAGQSARAYPRIGQADLQLATDRCRINVIEIILTKMVEGVGQSPK